MLLETGEVLGLIGLDPLGWQNMIRRGHFPAAPPVRKPGGPRMFDRDDVTALFMFDHLRQLGVSIPAAGKSASEGRQLLRQHGEGLEHLYVIVSGDNRPRLVTHRRPRPDQTALEFPVAVARAEIERFMLEKAGGRPA